MNIDNHTELKITTQLSHEADGGYRQKDKQVEQFLSSCRPHGQQPQLTHDYVFP